MNNNNNSSYDECLKVLLYGIDYAKYKTYVDKNIYYAYKVGLINEVTEKQLQDITVLSLLEDIGYSMIELGTYFYKDVILKVIETLNNSNNIEETIKELLSQLSDSNSQFHANIAKNDFDMDAKIFYNYIQKSISKIDNTKIKEEHKLRFNNKNAIYEERTISLGMYIIERNKLEKYLSKKKILTNV